MGIVSSQTVRAITADDLYEIVVTSDPQVSPDGTHILWVQNRPDRDDDGYRSAIWIARSDGSTPHQLTSGRHRDQAPRWAPDSSTVAFVSNRPSATSVEGDSPEKPVNQIWTIRIDGGEAIQRTSHPGGAASPSWSPAGDAIAFVGNDEPGDGDTDAPTGKGSIADERIVRRINYRGDGRGYIEKYSHIWIADLVNEDSRQLTTGDAFDRDPAWSPDGARIAFTSNRTDDRDAAWSRAGISIVDVTGGEPIALTPDDSRFGSAAWSPDGARIAFSGHLGINSATHAHIWTVQSDGSQLVDHTASHDIGFGDSGMGDLANGSPEGPLWRDATTILALASAHGETQVHAVNVESGSVDALTTGSHRISGFSPLGDDLVVIRGAINRPFAVDRIDLEGGFTTVSTVNDDILAEIALVDAIPLEVTSADGTPIQAWILPPVGFDPSSAAKHPMILQIHGGPHAMYGYALFHEMQLMAAKGYAVLFSNPRGSAGYGETFMSCTRGTWGESDMPDVIAAVEAATALPWIDADRLGITGGSYGGYLTNWIIGHDQRFRAAVTQRCVANFHSFVGTSDIGTTFGIFEFDGTPWADASKLLHHSPISYVASMDTPLLILHSEQDLRCPIEQAEQLFASLKHLGKEVEFVRFPEEGHELSRSGKPTRRLARLHYLIAWFDQHL